MPSERSKSVKSSLHPRNRNRERYDLSTLMKVLPALAKFVKPNKYGDDSIDFSNPEAVKALNTSILKHYYGIEHWDFPSDNLCPPIPGRADYLHYMADLFAESNNGHIPKGKKITCFDIGVGASVIYPIIGVTEYGWNFIGSEIHPKSLKSARKNIKANSSLQGKVDLRFQEYSNHIFQGVLNLEEKVDLCICNPPFHASMADVEKSNQRKIKNLTGKKSETPEFNFSGEYHELIYKGGEYRFIQNMIRESKKYAKNCFWCSVLVSKKDNLKAIYKSLELREVNQIKTIPMGTGNKSTRIVAWTYLSAKEQKEWSKARWPKS